MAVYGTIQKFDEKLALMD